MSDIGIVVRFPDGHRTGQICYLPAYVNPQSDPEVLTRKDPRAQEVYEYVNKISQDQELMVGFSWDGDEVLISAAGVQRAQAVA